PAFKTIADWGQFGVYICLFLGIMNLITSFSHGKSFVSGGIKRAVTGEAPVQVEERRAVEHAEATAARGEGILLEEVLADAESLKQDMLKLRRMEASTVPQSLQQIDQGIEQLEELNKSLNAIELPARTDTQARSQYLSILSRLQQTAGEIAARAYAAAKLLQDQINELKVPTQRIMKDAGGAQLDKDQLPDPQPLKDATKAPEYDTLTELLRKIDQQILALRKNFEQEAAVDLKSVMNTNERLRQQADEFAALAQQFDALRRSNRQAYQNVGQMHRVVADLQQKAGAISSDEVANQTAEAIKAVKSRIDQLLGQRNDIISKMNALAK
ncbi:MAG: hypothetical protein AABY13_03325, partial [Nanoarchaeota archaeon]